MAPFKGKEMTRREILVGSVLSVAILVAIILGVTAFSAGSRSSQNAVPTITLSGNPASSSASTASAESTGAAETSAPVSTTGKTGTGAGKQSKAGFKASSKKLQPGSPSDYSSGGKSQSSKARADLLAMLPQSFSGYSLGGAPGLPSELNDVVMDGQLSSGSGPVTKIIWAVHDLETSSTAQGFISRTSKQLYPSDANSLAIAGVQAYFGTDGQQNGIASVAFAKSHFVFEILATVSGPDPYAGHDTAVSAAHAFRVPSNLQ